MRPLSAPAGATLSLFLGFDRREPAPLVYNFGVFHREDL